MFRYGLILLLSVLIQPVQAQKGFQFASAKDRITVPFKTINNLIFIPVTVNGVALTFLVDTGVEETVLLSLEDQGDVAFHNVQKIKLKGLGNEDAIEGLKSAGNVVSIGGIIDKAHDLYIVLDQGFNFSAHIGIPVNGIIGYHFFKDHLVEIDYDSHKLTVWRDNPRRRKKIESRYTAFPITLEKNKPYLTAEVQVAERPTQTKLLIDIGNSDALWLFGKAGFVAPNPQFEDYLGKGFSGDIFGKRARIDRFTLGQFRFDWPIIAFPDSTSLQSVNMVRDRGGSVGGEILKRFDVVFDYTGRKLYLRKSNHYQDVFHYNMSGLELQNDGTQWVPETVSLQTVQIDNVYDESGKKDNFRYKFSLKPVFTIASVRPNSPAARVGLLKDDIVVSVNGAKAYRYTLEQINQMLRSEEGRTIYLEVEREGKVFKFSFALEKLL